MGLRRECDLRGAGRLRRPPPALGPGLGRRDGRQRRSQRRRRHGGRRGHWRCPKRWGRRGRRGGVVLHALHPALARGEAGLARLHPQPDRGNLPVIHMSHSKLSPSNWLKRNSYVHIALLCTQRRNKYSPETADLPNRAPRLRFQRSAEETRSFALNKCAWCRRMAGSAWEVHGGWEGGTGTQDNWKELFIFFSLRRILPLCSF